MQFLSFFSSPSMLLDCHVTYFNDYHYVTLLHQIDHKFQNQKLQQNGNILQVIANQLMPYNADMELSWEEKMIHMDNNHYWVAVFRETQRNPRRIL